MAPFQTGRRQLVPVIDRVAPESRRGRVLGRLDESAFADADERARERHRRIGVATIAGGASRALTALTLVVALPLASSHLSPEELGVWSLLVTTVALLGFADLGLSNGLLNVLSDALGRDDRRVARRAVTAALLGLSALALAGAVMTVALMANVSWYRLLHVDPIEVPQLDLAIWVFALNVLVMIPAGIGQRIHMAYQQGWAAAATNGVGSVFALMAVVAAAVKDASLPWFVAAMLGGPALAYLAESAWLFGRSHRDLRPRRGDLDLQILRRLLRSGFLFFLLAAAGAIAYQSDSLVIARYLGAAEVTRYAVSLRLFMLAPSALTAILMPLWPAYGEALARHDDDWVRVTLRRSLLLSLAVSAASSGAMFALARPLLTVWSPNTASPSVGLLLALAAWAVVSSFSMALAMYLNGAGVIRFQVVAATVMAVTNLALSIALVRRLGAAGPVWASVITQTLVVVGPVLVIVYPVMRRGPQVSLSTRSVSSAPDRPEIDGGRASCQSG